MLYCASNSLDLHGTTILCVKIGKDVVIAADGQVSHGPTILKSTSRKLRTLGGGSIIAGFAGSTADALTLFERLEGKLEKHSNHLTRAAVELAKDWRMDKYLRKLEAMMIVADKETILILTGNGDVIEPEYNIAAIGSGGIYALAAARAAIQVNKNLLAEEVAKIAMNIAADICVYSNHNIITEKVTSHDK